MLPTDALALVLGRLDMRDRSVAACTCQAFRAAAAASADVARAVVSITSGDDPTLELPTRQLASLGLWLQRHSTQLTRLEVLVRHPDWDEYTAPEVSLCAPEDLDFTRSTCLQVLALGPLKLARPLRQLQHLQQLRQLALDSVVSASGASLAGLGPALARLPALTALDLEGYTATQAPQVIKAVTGLSRLLSLGLGDTLAHAMEEEEEEEEAEEACGVNSSRCVGARLPSGLTALRLGTPVTAPPGSLACESFALRRLALGHAAWRGLASLAGLRDLELHSAVLTAPWMLLPGLAGAGGAAGGVQLERLVLEGWGDAAPIGLADEAPWGLGWRAQAYERAEHPPAKLPGAQVAPELLAPGSAAAEDPAELRALHRACRVRGLLRLLCQQTRLTHLHLERALRWAVGGPSGSHAMMLAEMAEFGEQGLLPTPAPPERPEVLRLYGAGLVHTSLRHLHVVGTLAASAGHYMFGANASLANGSLRQLTHLTLGGAWDEDHNRFHHTFLTPLDVAAIARACGPDDGQLQQLSLVGSASPGQDFGCFRGLAHLTSLAVGGPCGVAGIRTLVGLRDLELDCVEVAMLDMAAFAKHLTGLTRFSCSLNVDSDVYDAFGTIGPERKHKCVWNLHAVEITASPSWKRPLNTVAKRLANRIPAGLWRKLRDCNAQPAPATEPVV